MYVIVPAERGVPDVSAHVVMAIKKDETSAYANVDSDTPDPSWVTITDPEIIAQLMIRAETPPPETGPMLMDIILKQAELEMKLDAIGTMLVPTLPEV